MCRQSSEMEPKLASGAGHWRRSCWGPQDAELCGQPGEGGGSLGSSPCEAQKEDAHPDVVVEDSKSASGKAGPLLTQGTRPLDPCAEQHSGVGASRSRFQGPFVEKDSAVGLR